MDKVLSFHRAKKGPSKTRMSLDSIEFYAKYPLTAASPKSPTAHVIDEGEKLFLQLFISIFMLFSVEMENLRNDL